MHVFGEVITTGGAGSTDYERFLKPYLDSSGQEPMTFRCLPPCVARWGMAAA